MEIFQHLNFVPQEIIEEILLSQDVLWKLIKIGKSLKVKKIEI
jgi:hypothetical protein